MPVFDVEFHLNETTTAEGIPAPWIRIGQDRVQPGDTFRYVTTVQLSAPSARATLEMAFEAGNGQDVPGSREFDRYTDRNMCVGDVIVVHTPDGVLVAYADSCGWVDIEDIEEYNLTIGEPSRARA